MTVLRSLKWATPAVILTALVSQGTTRGDSPFLIAASAQSLEPLVTCDLEAYSRSEAEFNRLVALSRFNPDAVSAESLRAASGEYVLRGEACFKAMYGNGTQPKIDDGGVWYSPDGSQPY